MAKAALKATWTDTNSDETITYVQISTDSKSMIAHEVDQITKRGWMNIGNVPANVTEFPFELELPFTFVRTRIRPSKIGTRPAAWIPEDGQLLSVSVDGAPINVVSDVGLQILNAPEVEDPGDSDIPPPSSITDLGVVAGGEDDELDISFTAVNDGTGNAAKYRVRFQEGTTPSIQFANATPATDTCGTATPPASIGDPVTCTISGLKTGTAYQVQAESYRGVIGTDAVFGGRSNIDTGTTTGTELEPLLAPQNLSPQGNTTAGSKTFSWSAVAGADEYRVRIHIHGQPYSPLTVPTNYLVAGDQATTSVNATVGAGVNYDWWIAGLRDGIEGPSTGGALFVAAGTATNPTPVSLLPSPTTVEVGNVRLLTVTLSGAYDQPVVVTIQSSNVPAATVPASITIPVGSTTGTFNVTGVAAGSATISATYNGTTRQASVTVEAETPPPGGLWPNQPAGMTVLTDHAMNSKTIAGWNQVWQGSQIIQDSSAPLSPPSIMRDTWVNHSFSDISNIYYTFPAGTSEFYLGFWWRPSNPFYGWTGVSTQKIWLLEGSHTYLSMIRVSGGGASSQYRLNIFPDAGNGNCHVASGASCDTLNANIASPLVPLGSWNRVEWHYKASLTNTSQDGICRWWMNNTLMGSYTNINTNVRTFNTIMYTHVWDAVDGQAVTDTHDLDHVRIARR